ncbi:MAG: glycosyltransferase family 4 protein [Erythrobacter sp.]|nr:glycosyltransferase family 4 protein [Erythrobacter sp.]
MKVLICYPFHPSSGAGGRKQDAVESFEAMHRLAGVVFEPLYLDDVVAEAAASLSNNQSSSCLVRFLARRESALPRMVAAALVTRKRVREGRFEAVMIYGLTILPILAGVLIAILNKLPYFIYEHRSYYGELRKNHRQPSRFIRFALMHARQVLCLTPGHRADIQCHFPNTDPKILLIPPAEAGGSAGKGKLIPQVSDRFTVGAWANWREIKRLDVLIEAFCRFSSVNGSALLKVAGPVPENAVNSIALEKIDQCASSANIELLGPLKRSDVTMLSRECDLAVISSDYESYGLPAVEALMVGTPIVTTDCNGPPSFIESGRNGIVVPINDPEAMAKALQSISENAQTFSRTAISASAQRRFSLEGQAKVLAQIYGIGAAVR